MKAIDKERVLRVWQRVRSAPEVPDLRFLAAETLTAAVMLRTLSRRFRDYRRDILWEMAQQELSQGALLKGMIALTLGSEPGIRAEAVKLERTENLLRRCWEGMVHRSKVYSGLRTDPEFGRIYTHLAAREEEHSRQLLAILGAMGGSGTPRRSGQP